MTLGGKFRELASVLFLGSLVVACAASAKRSADSPAATGTQPQEPAAYSQPGSVDAAKSAKGDVAQPPPPPPPAPQGTSQQPQGGFAQPPPNRGVALAQAGNDVDTAQRELDVAASDCRNACRALSSMDRAAGRLCGLAQSTDEKRRCDDVKNKVYTARDRVKSTCGQCDDITVDRNAPIPSR